ncbi:MAG TPA: hypothetical protein VGS12_10520 [Caulobacteraceae bacterium]|nr:hypothetical protein [Caulobacteraceae bacterium]
MRTLPIVLACLGLAACAGLPSKLAFWRHFERRPATALASAAPDHTDRAPQIAPGLWAILDPGCATPTSADTSKWAACASPFWIGKDFAVVVQRRPGQRGGATEASYKAAYRLAAGAPLIAEVGDEKHGHLFLALTGLSHDAEGRLTGAAAAPFACQTAKDGDIAAAANSGGCESASIQGMRAAARASLRDPAALTRVAFVAEGAPQF